MALGDRPQTRLNRGRALLSVAALAVFLALVLVVGIDRGGAHEDRVGARAMPPGAGAVEGVLSEQGPAFGLDRFAPSDVAAVEQPVWPAGAATPLELAAGAGGPTATPAPSVSHGAAVALEPPPPIGAAAYAVVERECGALLWGMNETQHLPPASLTKIVTALVVMDSTALDEVVQSNVSAQELQDRGSSVMGLEPGDSLSVLDLLNGMLLESGNDAALVLAQHAAGSVDAFVEKMNATAAALGMTDTHFANPHGLDSRDHYSTALDMAKAGLALLDDPVLAEIAATSEYWPQWEKDSVRNGNKLLERYPGAYGVKIGYTRRANQTMVAAAQRGGRHIVVSLLGSENRYGDTTVLLDWAFSKTTPACG